MQLTTNGDAAHHERRPLTTSGKHQPPPVRPELVEGQLHHNRRHSPQAENTNRHPFALSLSKGGFTTIGAHSPQTEDTNRHPVRPELVEGQAQIDKADSPRTVTIFAQSATMEDVLGPIWIRRRLQSSVVHAVMVANHVNQKLQSYSCQRRQLRSSRLIPG